MSLSPFVATGTLRNHFQKPTEKPLEALLLERFPERGSADPALITTATRLARSFTAEPATRLQVASAILGLLLYMSDGHTQITFDDLQAFDPELDLELLSSGALATLFGHLSEDLSSEAELPFCPLLLCTHRQGAHQKFLTTHRLFTQARTIATRAYLLAEQTKPHIDGAALQNALQDLRNIHSGFQLNDEKFGAVELAAHSPLTIITGGPGTGKTTIIVSILRTLVRLGIDPERIALAAPTGKAAFRMRESIKSQLHALQSSSSIPAADLQLRDNLPDSLTLHRLLGYSPTRGRFYKNAETPIDADLIICDEASMIDLELMHGLFQALPGGVRLLLTGDADQLPAVESGAAFSNLIDAFPTHTARLRESFRQSKDNPEGSALYELSRAIATFDSADTANPGENKALQEALGTPQPLCQPFRPRGICRLQDDTDFDDFLGTWFEEFIDPFSLGSELPQVRSFHRHEGRFTPEACQQLQAFLTHYNHARQLAATRVGPRGVNRINRILHTRFQNASNLGRQDTYIHLEPVMVLKNNYEFQVFNGDQGIIANVYDVDRKATTKEVIFPREDGSFRAIHLSQIQHQIEHAYALSIHKSQGSEYHHVALILPDEPSSLLTRELLYTAITRASKSLTLYDPENLFPQAVATRTQRRTNLRSILELQTSAAGRPASTLQLQESPEPA